MKRIFFLILLTSCTSSNSAYKSNTQNFNLSKNLNFDEFTKMLIQYANENPNPDINK